MGHANATDYAKRAKQGFFLGFGLFALGAGGELVGHSVYGELPGWEQALLFDAEVLGILVALLVPLVFGIVMPLVE
jgi:hydrogenase/urease accessory protein HupE